MSNSFSSPPTFTDPQAVVAGQPIASGPVARIGETLNYAFGRGGITNVISLGDANHDHITGARGARVSNHKHTTNAFSV